MRVATSPINQQQINDSAGSAVDVSITITPWTDTVFGETNQLLVTLAVLGEARGGTAVVMPETKEIKAS